MSFNIDYASTLVENDANYQYPMPNDYKYIQLPKLNRFIELWGRSTSSETEITRFLAKASNKFILTMRFGATDAHSELLCEWQSDERKSIKPDFFVVQPDGFADIVEFKLPDVLGNSVVGAENRERFSAWLAEYVAQTRVYKQYFEDPNNRKWFEEKYGFEVYNPRRVLVVGRSFNFKSQVWREITADHVDLNIITFDDLVAGVKAQFYRD